MADIGHIEIDTEDETPIITLEGEFDLSNAPQLVQIFDDLADQDRTRVILDLSRTTFIDSTVLGALGLAYRRGLMLNLRGADGLVKREIDRSGLSAVFDVS